MMKFETPMMQQYEKIKADYPDCLLFFRLGDFYELFLEDAEIGSKVLDITLTARSKGKDGKIPMCGVPFHSIDAYLSKIIKAGYKAAICEQTSKPTKGTEIVEREVVRIITPGTVVDENMLERKSNNFVLTLNHSNNEIAFAYSDISTGDFTLNKTSYKGQTDLLNTILNEVKKINPNEIVLQTDLYENFQLIRELRNIDQANIYPLKVENLKDEVKIEWLKNFFKIKTLLVFGVEETDSLSIGTIYNLLNYLNYTQKNNLYHIKNIKNDTDINCMRIDSEAFKNLEIFESLRTSYTSKKTNSLFDVIDKTSTPMGGRLLKTWLLYPSISKSAIEKRYECIEGFLKNHKLRSECSNVLNRILDIERLLSKLGTGTANGRDLYSLSISIRNSTELIKLLKQSVTLTENLLPHYSEEILDSAETIFNKIDSVLKNDPPFSIREGGLIKNGINEDLDAIKQSISDSQTWISELEAQERENTGINTLKVGFNSVFGYYIEVSKANANSVPANYVRKQTLVNAERYITQELKSHEEVVLNAKEKIDQLEYEIFIELVNKVLEDVEKIQEIAKIVAQIDCIVGFAEIASSNNYIKPNLSEMGEFNLALDEARHPVVEKVLPPGDFTPNSTHLSSKHFIQIITGPNMAGKSTYIRQVAIMQLMAQIGSFVPAQKANISIVDGIYTRIGSGDALSQGLSTFMVEMIETAKILNNATQNSLIILDEVGRGTSTIDGYSIAKAVLEYIHNKLESKTLFATHFHELVNLEQRLKKIENYHVKVSEEDGEIKFMHKVEKGGTDKSYGIEVAKLAGIPEEVVNRAKEILSQNTNSQLRLDI